MRSKMHRTHSGELSEEDMNKDTNSRVCVHQSCRMEFVPTRKWQLYCSPECKAAFWRELRAEVMREILLKRKERPSPLSKKHQTAKSNVDVDE